MEDFVDVKDISFQFKFKWKINNNFCTNDNHCELDFLESSKVFKSKNEWLFLRLFPKNLYIMSLFADNNEYKNYFILSLYSSTEIKAVKDIKIFGCDGGLLAHQTVDETTRNGHKCNIDGTMYWESTMLILRDSIFNPANDTLNHDSITIACKVTYSDNKTFNKKEEEDALPRLEDDYEALLKDDNFSDVSLISEGKILKLHKCILASKSSVFAAMFCTEMIEKQNNRVDIADVQYDVLVEMIRYIYTRKVNNIDMIAGKLAIAADKYALDDLKITCENTLKKNLKLDNLIESLQLADKLHMNKLKNKCIEFVVEDASEIIDKPEFNLLPDDIVRKAFFMSNKKKLKF